MSEDNIKKAGMAAFNLRAKSEEGIKMELTIPGVEDTGEFLIIRGADSTTFRKAQARTNRKNLDMMKLNSKKNPMSPVELAMKQAKIQTELVASLVAGWSFEDEDGKPIECTLKTVSDFLETAPQIQEQIDQVAGERHNFFNMPSNVCENSPEEISG